MIDSGMCSCPLQQNRPDFEALQIHDDNMGVVRAPSRKTRSGALVLMGDFSERPSGGKRHEKVCRLGEIAHQD